MSIEAMGMAGMGYKECVISLEEWDTIYQEQLICTSWPKTNELANLAAEGIKAKTKNGRKPLLPVQSNNVCDK